MGVAGIRCNEGAMVATVMPLLPRRRCRQVPPHCRQASAPIPNAPKRWLTTIRAVSAADRSSSAPAHRILCDSLLSASAARAAEEELGLPWGSSM